MFDVICVTARKQSTNFLDTIENVAKSNVKMIILHEKDMEESEYMKLAKQVNEICKCSNKDLVIHNFISVAEKLGIKKIHLSFDEFCKNENIKEKFEYVGTSIHSVEDAVLAKNRGADYIIAGHIFKTDCKKGLEPRGIKFLQEICESVDIPVYAIGGINKRTVDKLSVIKSKNLKGVCIMSEFMKVNSNSKFLLYAVTDRNWLNGRELREDVEKALKGGVTLVQLREKGLDFESFCKEAEIIHELCKSYGVPLIINDNIEVAKAVDAEGVHLGQTDESPMMARKILGKGKIIGVTARNVKQAINAEKAGADYIGSGAIFGTSTKNDAKKMDFETLKDICASVTIPVTAIGGITKENISLLKDMGISGVAVVSGIFAEKDVENTTKELRDEIEAIVYEK